MLKSLVLNGFNALPHLAGTALMTRHGGRLVFSLDKPNVVVGPNGAGKTALLDAISLRFLAHLTNESLFHDDYVGNLRNEEWWSREHSWHEWRWLHGLACDTDEAPVLSYRPNRVPGNRTSGGHARMCGYTEEAKELHRAEDKRSSGQRSQTLLERILNALAGHEDALPARYQVAKPPYWSDGTEPRDLGRNPTHLQERAEVLKRILRPQPGAQPLILLDEPEQSLDAKAELMLWKRIEQADCTRMQVIVATHSLYPLMHRDRYNIIEAEEGYVDEVVRLLT